MASPERRGIKVSRNIMALDGHGNSPLDVVPELGFNASSVLIRIRALSKSARTTGDGTSGAKALTLAAVSTFADGDTIGIYNESTLTEYEINTIASGGGTTAITLTTNMANTYNDARVIKVVDSDTVTKSNNADDTETIYQRFGA